MGARVLIFTESSLGGGHHNVAAKLSRKLSDVDAKVGVVSGSMDVGRNFDYGKAAIFELPKLDFPPGGKEARIDNVSFRLDKQDRSNLAHYMDKLIRLQSIRESDTTTPLISLIHKKFTEKQKKIKDIIRDFEPTHVVTEFWPLGRDRTTYEMVPLMNYLSKFYPNTKKIALERDVVVPPKDGTKAEARIDRINNLHDAAFIRGDDNIVRLRKSYPQVKGISIPVSYPGYFTNGLPTRNKNIPIDKRDVVVSAGGGFRPEDVSYLKTAIKSKKYTEQLRDRTWRIMVPPNCPENIFQDLTEYAFDDLDIVVSRNLPYGQFQQALSDSALSISQGGYNTTLELASGEAPAIVVPMPDNSKGPNEQDIRSKIFEKMGLFKVVDLDEMVDNATSFAEQIDKEYHRGLNSEKPDLKIKGHIEMAKKIVADAGSSAQSKSAVSA